MRTVICDYCGHPAKLVDSAIVYEGRSYGMIWYCKGCRAWVGCHRGTNEPLGRLANAELRKQKRIAHAMFDPLWHGKEKWTRRAAYEWLAEEMGLPLEQTHIGMMDIEQCKEVIRICKEAKKHEQLQKMQQPQGQSKPHSPAAEERRRLAAEDHPDGDPSARAAHRG